MAPSARAVGFTTLAVVVSAVCVVAGTWQGVRTRDIVEAEQASASAPIPVLDSADVEGFPATSIGRPVTAVGEYDGDQLLVAQREFDGRPGEWVVAPLVIDGTTVAVLRGWIDSPDSPALAIPDVPVSITGAMQPFEEFYAERPRLPDGRLVAMSRGELEAAWGTPILSLVLVLSEQSPMSVPGPLPVPLTVQTANVPFPLQNAAYTLQWFVFAVFVWVMWWLWVVRPHPDSLEIDAKEMT